MAKQMGVLKLTGMFDNLVFYKAFGKLLVKRKEGFDVNKEKKDPELYKLKLRSENNFKRATKLASTVYRTLPKERKEHGLFGELTKAAVKVLHEGGNEEEVMKRVKEVLNLE